MDLDALLRYDPDTGFLHWKIERAGSTYTAIHHTQRPRPAIHVGDRADYEFGEYRAVSCKGDTLLAHRVAWLLMTGAWPAMGIDHADRDKVNNRWSNLRLATPSQNGVNIAPRRGQAFKGVSRAGERYAAHHAGKYLGRFDTQREAARAYDAAALAAHGEFAVLNFPQEQRS